MDNIATFEQAKHALKLIGDKDLSRKDTHKLHLCLPPLMDGIKNGTLTPEILSAIAENRAKVEILEHIIDFDEPAFVPMDWSILSNDEQLPNRVKGKIRFDQKKIATYIDKSQKDEVKPEGLDLRKKFAYIPVYGAQLLDFYLANQHLIPEEWKDKAVFFWGTIYRDSEMALCVRYLLWDGNRWDWSYRWLGSKWCGDDLAAVSAS